MTLPAASLLFESCVENYADALHAQQRGAHRVELCSALDEDGLTPDREVTRQCVLRLTIPVMVMIRPRGGDFVYTPAELATMAAEIAYFKTLGGAGVAGFVFGVLDAGGAVDVAATARLCAAAQPLAVTFHQAIDATPDPLAALRAVDAIADVTRVLTSGGQETAWQGRDVLRAMNALAGRRVVLIAAGKVSVDNRQAIAEYTGIGELHGKRVV